MTSSRHSHLFFRDNSQKTENGLVPINDTGFDPKAIQAGTNIDFLGIGPGPLSGINHYVIAASVPMYYNIKAFIANI